MGFLGRHARMSDFLVDAASSCLGVGLSYALLKLRAAVIRGERPNRNASLHASCETSSPARSNPDVQVNSLTNDGTRRHRHPEEQIIEMLINPGIDAESKTR
jgi:hypothetical protein